MGPITPFPRKAIDAGIFDGRFAGPYFIQQEGTFWRSTLWKKAGGLDANFRLAGDFDLWRRFAKQSELVVVDTILGCFRFRTGQLSTNLARYQAEIDASLSPDELKIRAKAAKSYAKAGFAYLSSFVITWGHGDVSVGRCASRPVSAPSSFARNIFD